MAKKLNYIKEVFYDSCTRLSTGDGFAIHKKKKTRMRNHNHIICFLVYIFKTSQLRSHESDGSRGSSLD
jgi:hypothetical protein